MLPLDLRIKTYKLTVSVPGDISEECVTAVTKYWEKRCSRMYTVLERGAGDRLHLHSCLLLQPPPLYSGLKQAKFKFYKTCVLPYHPEARGKFAVTLITMYDHDWYKEYLKKEAGVQVIVDNYDEAEFSAAFPTPDEQASIQDQQANNPHEPTCFKLANLYRAEGHDFVSYERVLEFITDKALSQEITPPKDERTQNALCVWVFRILNNWTGLTPSQKAWCKKMEDREFLVYKGDEDVD